MTKTMIILLSFVTGLLAMAPPASADIPITGKPVPELVDVDDMVTGFMEANDIDAGLVGIMVNGVIVYQRGFGWADPDHQQLMRHDDLMRCASVTKPFTAAAVQKLYATTDLDPTDLVFDLGQEGGGLLSVSPLEDPSLVPELITVDHLLYHTSGMPTNDENDPMFREVEIADDFNDAGIETSYPPGILRTTDWVLGQDFGILGATSYSNVGFMVLGQIVVQKAEMTHIDYVREQVLGPIDWLPVSEVVMGRTDPVLRDPREPYYDNDTMMQNVFDPDGPNVLATEGGYHHELHFASGAFVVSTTALLHLAENFYVSHNSGKYGLPVNGNREGWSHGGLLPGVSSVVQQRSDGVNFAVLFNKGDDIYASQLQTGLNNLINNGLQWPTQGVDGQWVDFGANGADEGSYEQPWEAIPQAVQQVVPESTLNINAGSTDWTGTINKRMRIRAHYGTVTIGD